MRKILLLILLVFLVSCSDESLSISSPDETIEVVFKAGKAMTYQVKVDDDLLIAESKMGFKLDADDFEEFDLVNYTTSSFDETWSPVWGQRSEIKNHYNQLVLNLEKDDQKLNIIFRVFNDGIGFRYEFPEQAMQAFEIMDELTEFKFTDDHTAWWIKNDWDSYEYLYRETPLSKAVEVSTPFTIKTDKLHISVHEAALIDYAGMALKQTDALTFESHLAPWPDGSKVKLTTPAKTPWRTIQIGRDAGDLIESSLILNLNEPSDYEDTSWIKPMKYMGIWWEMHINKSDWGQHNDNHGATTENAKSYIDFINSYLSDDETIGLLVEGWNQGWDGNWMDNYDKFIFTEAGEYNDFDVSEVAEYAKDRNVSFIIHNETSGGIENYDRQMVEAYSDYQRLGIHAIKSGYVSDNGMQAPEKVHHHGQYMVNHYNNAVELAADYQLMINTHEPIKPTGLSRTYPNWVAREGVQGMEYNAWSDGNPPEHTTILPFTRILGGPIDYTPGIFDVEVGGRANRVHTTRAKQLALYVVLYSPLQMITDLPENYLDENGKPYQEFEFIQNVPVDWAETVVPNAEIGEFVTIARKDKNSSDWYIGSITDEEARIIETPLNFLDGQVYKATVYADGEGVDYLNNPNEVMIYQMLVTRDDVLRFDLLEGGGQAVHLTPADEKAVRDLENYRYLPVKKDSIVVPKEILSNETLNIAFNYVNDSTVVVSDSLEIILNNDVFNKKISVKPTAKSTLYFEYDKLFEPGLYDILIDQETYQVKVSERPATFVYDEISTFTNGSTATIRVKIKNIGSVSGEKTVQLYVNDTLVQEESMTIEAGPGGVVKGINFKYDMLDKGAYTFRVDNEATFEIEN